ncbi:MULTISPECIES: hypothetical protein [unclassified Bacillus (in: firmicutes)]
MEIVEVIQDNGEKQYFRAIDRWPLEGDWILPVDNREKHMDKCFSNRFRVLNNLRFDSVYKVIKVKNVKHVIIKDDIGDSAELDSYQYKVLKTISPKEINFFNDQIHVLKHLDSNLKKLKSLSSNKGRDCYKN